MNRTDLSDRQKVWCNRMQILNEKRCIIGEGPVWNDFEKRLYYTNGMGGSEICMLDIYTGKLEVRPVKTGCAAFAFDKNNRLIVSRPDGVFILNDDDSITELYDTKKYNITFANDMKVGPDGRIYVGTQSGKRKGVSDKVDGKLYSIDKDGSVRILLDNLRLSNGLDWSMDEKRLYHTDSDTGIIKEYDFDKEKGTISFTGRQVNVRGVDGFTIDKNDFLYVACWGQGHIAIIDTADMQVKEYIEVPAKIPASCGFAGENMGNLVVVTATLGIDVEKDVSAGFTFMKKMNVSGRKPYLFG